MQIFHRLAYHARNVLDSNLSEIEKSSYLRYMLMMIRGYRQSCVELYGASGASLLAVMEGKDIPEQDEERARRMEKIASLETEIAMKKGKHEARHESPIWKMTAPIRKLTSSAKRAAKLFGSSRDS